MIIVTMMVVRKVMFTTVIFENYADSGYNRDNVENDANDEGDVNG